MPTLDDESLSTVDLGVPGDDSDTDARRVTIPPTVDDAARRLGGLHRLIQAREWERAAIVYAFTKDEGRGSRVVSSDDSRLTFTAFAALGIAGLASHNTVSRYHRAWAGIGRPCLPGQTVNLDGLGTFPAYDGGNPLPPMAGRPPWIPGWNWEREQYPRVTSTKDDPGRAEFNEALALTCAVHEVTRILAALNRREDYLDFKWSRFVNPDPGWADRVRVELLEQIPAWRNVIEQIETLLGETLVEEIADLLDDDGAIVRGWSP